MKINLPPEFLDNYPLVMATNLCIGPNRHPVRFILREEPNNEADSGWVFFSGNEPEGYCDVTENFSICPLKSFIEWDPAMASLLSSPIGSVFEHSSETGGWQEVHDYHWD